MTENHIKKKDKFLIKTDYAIPRFGFKQSIILLLTLFITFTIGSVIVESVADSLALPAIFIVSLVIGFQFHLYNFIKKRM